MGVVDGEVPVDKTAVGVNDVDAESEAVDVDDPDAPEATLAVPELETDPE